MIITVGGDFGSGKTTLASALAQTLGYDELKVGNIVRMMAADRGVKIDEFSELLKVDPKLERLVDEQQTNTMKERDNLVVQSRLAWYFAKESPFKVFNICLVVDPKIGAQRTATHMENLGKNPDSILAMNLERKQNELERFRSLYNIENYLDRSHYDLVLDTTNLSVGEKLTAVLEKIKPHGNA